MGLNSIVIMLTRRATCEMTSAVGGALRIPFWRNRAGRQGTRNGNRAVVPRETNEAFKYIRGKLDRITVKRSNILTYIYGRYASGVQPLGGKMNDIFSIFGGAFQVGSQPHGFRLTTLRFSVPILRHHPAHGHECAVCTSFRLNRR